MNAKLSVPESITAEGFNHSLHKSFAAGGAGLHSESFSDPSTLAEFRSTLHFARKRLSPWSRSIAKRIFDLGCVLAVLPVVLPVLLLTAFAVRFTSPGPVLFFQKRAGRYGRSFTIFKFRTMVHTAGVACEAATTARNQRFTAVGPFLRKWKLDELPQLLNVLAGDMSLVGPRPKMPEFEPSKLLCRPGITGAATILFAREESFLERIPKHQLRSYYHSVVLPAKRRLDSDYMGRATFLSDLKLLFDTVTHRWDSTYLEKLIGNEASAVHYGAQKPPAGVAADAPAHPVVPHPVVAHLDRPIAAEHYTNL